MDGFSPLEGSDEVLANLYRINSRQDEVIVRLACGHWHGHLSPASSTFDFPDDPLWCRECNAERQMDVVLQERIYTSERFA